MTNPEDVLAYWLDELGPKDWFTSSEALDQEIRDKFLDAWQQTMDGCNSLWLTHASGTLAYIILTDQFSRNMFRDTDQAFASDKLARAASKSAIAKGWDLRIDGTARRFFYTPLLHSENLCDQERCVRLIKTRMDDPDGLILLHAKAHREIIRLFGRFPFRNKALSRASTKQELAFIQDGGYGHIVQSLKAKLAA